MGPVSPVLGASADLIGVAARRQDWASVLRQLGLAVSDANIRAFRARALQLGLDITHLRVPGRIEDLSPEALQRASDGAPSQLEVLRRLGLSPGGRTYTSLVRVYERYGIPLPPRQPHGNAVHRGTDDELRAAYNRAGSVADALARSLRSD